jgi:hypothetical protein
VHLLPPSPQNLFSLSQVSINDQDLSLLHSNFPIRFLKVKITGEVVFLSTYPTHRIFQTIFY